MQRKLIPGTVIPYSEDTDKVFSLFSRMISAADGLTLAQVCSITGLEYSTVQNWIKRGFVAHPVNKKYYDKQLSRILIISALRDCMQIDKIGELMTLVNGDVVDESDDIISDIKLYDCLCRIINRVDGYDFSQPEMVRIIEDITSDCRLANENSGRKLTLALLVMICAYNSGKLKRIADLYFNQMREGGDI